MKEHALKYQSFGWSVIPLRWTGDVANRKKPIMDSWKSYQTTPATREQIEAWWTENPQANIGVLTGAISGIIVIDLDGPRAVDLLRSARVLVPHTASVSTGRGHHAYYKHPGYHVTGTANLLTDNAGSNVDVRGDGNYVVAPPSVHGSGRVYQWVIPPEFGVVDLPADLAALVTRKILPDAPENTDWVDHAMAGVPEGQRDDICARLAGYWLRLVGPDDCLRILKPFAEKCAPPFSERDLRKTVLSVARIEKARQDADTGKSLSKLVAIEAPAWLEEIEQDEGRKGALVNVPGFLSAGGIVPGDVITIAGRPGAGKSTLACQLTVEAGIRSKIPTLVVSTEMTRRQWGAWMASYLTGVTPDMLTRPLKEQARKEWLAAPVAIVDPGIVSIKEIRALAESRIGLKLLIVDHVGRVGGGRKESRVLEVGDVARGLKSIAKDLGCTVVSLCQMNRRVEGSEDKHPRLDDLRESGELEQESDSVMFLWTDDRDKTKAFLPMTISLEKNRHGATCDRSVTFDKPIRRFLFESEQPF